VAAWAEVKSGEKNREGHKSPKKKANRRVNLKGTIGKASVGRRGGEPRKVNGTGE